MARLLLLIIVLLLLTSIVDQLFPLVFNDLPAAGLALYAAHVLAFGWMLFRGNLLHSRYRSFFLGAMGLVMLAAAFKILHLQAADLLLGVSLTLLPAVYVLYFFSKPSKRFPDIAKVIAAVIYSLGSMSIHIAPGANQSSG